jgi:hypothetical protein
MNELNLSADAKRRLWQCYSLLLRLADEAKKNTPADPKLRKSRESTVTTKADERHKFPARPPKRSGRKRNART